MAVNKFGIGVPLESASVVAKNPYSPPGTPAPPKVSYELLWFCSHFYVCGYLVIYSPTKYQGI